MKYHERIVVISDLHLGGIEPAPARVAGTAAGSRINSSYNELAEFIDWVRQDPRSTELVLNGDIVDFLLDDDNSKGRAFIDSPQEACARLRRIASGCSAFEAWGEFARTERHRLTIILGNHDVELSFPAVRECFAELLGVGTHALHFVIDGEALVRGKVLIEHGNRYDPWNWVDHDGLRHERALQSRGLAADMPDGKGFIAPYGSHLVVELMNKLKERYRFVDLLKPETKAVLPLLLALDGRFQRIIRALIPACRVMSAQVDFSRTISNPFHQSTNIAGQGSVNLEAELNNYLQSVFGDEFKSLSWEPDPQNEIGLLEITEILSDATSALINQISGFCSNSVSNLFWGGLKGLNKSDQSFNPEHEESDYEDAAEEMATRGGFTVIIFGHTHLPKSLVLRKSRARYLNTGTWADVMRIERLGQYDVKELEQLRSDLDSNMLKNHVRRYLSYADVTINEVGTATSANVFTFLGPKLPAAPILSEHE